MKGFVVHTRPVPCSCQKTDAPTIVEVEYEIITTVEEPSVLFLPQGEFKARILKPEFLWEPESPKEKTLVPPGYYSHAVYTSLEEARTKAYKLVKGEFEFALRKRGTVYTTEEVEAKIADIQEMMLP